MKRKLFVFLMSITTLCTIQGAIVKGSFKSEKTGLSYIDWEENIITKGDFTDHPLIGIDVNGDNVLELKLDSAGTSDDGWRIHANTTVTYNSNTETNIWANGTEEEGWDIPKNLSQGTEIGASGNWIGAGDCIFIGDYGFGDPLFTDQETIFIGLRIDLNNNIHYGWAKLSTATNIKGGTTYSWEEIYYEDVANKVIKAGDKGSTSELKSTNTLSFSIYPNPVQNEIKIDGLNGGETISVFDITGSKRYVSKATSAHANINIAELPAGLYFVNIKGDEKSKTIKMTKK